MIMRNKTNSVDDRINMAIGLVLMARDVLNTTGDMRSYELDRAVDKLNITQELLNKAYAELEEGRGML
jgi:hypothetical protein